MDTEFALSLGSQRWTLPAESDSFTIGRASNADVRLQADDQISRIHARLVRTGPGWTLHDESRNGTGLNSRRLTAPTPLTEGDQIHIGRSVLTFHATGTATPSAAPAAPDIPEVPNNLAAPAAAPAAPTPVPDAQRAAPEQTPPIYRDDEYAPAESAWPAAAADPFAQGGSGYGAEAESGQSPREYAEEPDRNPFAPTGTPYAGEPDQAPHGYSGDRDDYDRGPQEYSGDRDDYDRGPQDYSSEGDEYDRGPREYSGEPGPESYAAREADAGSYPAGDSEQSPFAPTGTPYGGEPAEYDQAPRGYSAEPDQVGQGPREYSGEVSQADQGPQEHFGEVGQVGQGPREYSGEIGQVGQGPRGYGGGQFDPPPSGYSGEQQAGYQQDYPGGQSAEAYGAEQSPFAPANPAAAPGGSPWAAAYPSVEHADGSRSPWDNPGARPGSGEPPLNYRDETGGYPLNHGDYPLPQRGDEPNGVPNRGEAEGNPFTDGDGESRGLRIRSNLDDDEEIGTVRLLRVLAASGAVLGLGIVVNLVVALSKGSTGTALPWLIAPAVALVLAMIMALLDAAAPKDRPAGRLDVSIVVAIVVVLVGVGVGGFAITAIARALGG